MTAIERTRPQADSPEAATDINPRNMRICVWCDNRSREVCLPCEREGRYQSLEAAPLDSWEQPPELPAMRELVDLPAQEWLALVWLSVRYRELQDPPGDT
jgi:hypothetical protein